MPWNAFLLQKKVRAPTLDIQWHNHKQRPTPSWVGEGGVNADQLDQPHKYYGYESMSEDVMNDSPPDTPKDN